MTARCRRFAGNLACAFVVGLASLCYAHSSEAKTKLLFLDGRSVAWMPSAPRQPIRLTYAFATRAHAFPEAINTRLLVPMDQLEARSSITPAALRAATRSAFDLWERAANIAFSEITDDSRADIVIGAQGRPRGYAFTDVFHELMSDGTARIRKSLIALNPERRWKIGFDGDLSIYDIRHTMAHEIGHAIGLDHPSRTGQIMSYRYDEKLRSLQPGDIAGAIRLYGPRNPADPIPGLKPIVNLQGLTTLGSVDNFSRHQVGTPPAARRSDAIEK